MPASLPVIDMAKYRAGGVAAKADLVTQIASKSRSLGFFYLINHGVPDSLVEQQLKWSRKVFNLPLEQKQAVDFRRLPVRRGYEPMAQQTLQDGAPPDQKEAFSLGRELAPDHWLLRKGAPFEGPNQWPADGPGFEAAAFRTQMEAYRDAMVDLGRGLCGLLAVSLDLPEDYFADALGEPNASVRLLHYPPQTSSVATDHFGCGAHTDWGLITILLQDDCGGLEIDVGGEGWLKATPIPGALIVNLGDMVVRLTGGRYASNVHRVRNFASGRHRYSVATFFNPHAFYTVECVPSCATEPGRLGPVSFAEHINAMIKTTYAA